MTEPARRRARIRRLAWAGAGLFFVALGAVGAALPLLPTTPFLLLAAACFARSSPRLEAWLLAHRVFGPPVAGWRAHRAIPPAAKAMACAGVIVSYVSFWLGARPGWPAAAAMAALLLAAMAYVLSRPNGPPRARRDNSRGVDRDGPRPAAGLRPREGSGDRNQDAK